MTGILLQLDSEGRRLRLLSKTTNNFSIHLEVMEPCELSRLCLRLDWLLVSRLSIDRMAYLRGVFGTHKDVVDLRYLVAEEWLVILDSWRLEAQSFDLAWNSDADGPCKVLILARNNLDSLCIMPC